MIIADVKSKIGRSLLGRKEIFYLTTHTTHFIYGYMASATQIVRGNLLPPHGLLFPINGKGSFICTTPQPLLHQSWSTGWNEKHPKESTMKDRSDDPSHHERTLLPRSYISLHTGWIRLLINPLTGLRNVQGCRSPWRRCGTCSGSVSRSSVGRAPSSGSRPHRSSCREPPPRTESYRACVTLVFCTHR